MADDVADSDEWFTVTRTACVRASDPFSAYQASRGMPDDDLRITRHGSRDPRLRLAALRAANARDSSIIDHDALVERLTTLWTASGETTRSLGDKAGVSHATVAHYINGTMTSPQWRTLSAIVRALGGNPLDFLVGRGGTP